VGPCRPQVSGRISQYYAHQPDSGIWQHRIALLHRCSCRIAEGDVKYIITLALQAEVDLTMPEVAAASREFTALGRSVNTLGGLTTGGLTRPLETVQQSTGNSLRKVVSDMSQLTAVCYSECPGLGTAGWQPLVSAACRHGPSS
jgi:hypothetical protein